MTVSSRGWLTIHKPDSDQSFDRGDDIAALQLQVVQLAERVAVLEQRSARPTDADLITAITGATQGRAFSALELHRHARLIDHDLWAQLHNAGASTPRTLGKLLQRLSKVTTGIYQLRRMTRDAAGVVWEIRVCVSESDLHDGCSNGGR
jgi:hypothetical protein